MISIPAGSDDMRGQMSVLYAIYLSDSCMCFICLYECWVGPDARGSLMIVMRQGLSHIIDGSVPNKARFQAGPEGCWACPIVCLICMVWGILGNTLSFILTVFSLCFTHFLIKGEELGMIVSHTPYCSAFYLTMMYLDNY